MHRREYDTWTKLHKVVEASVRSQSGYSAPSVSSEFALDTLFDAEYRGIPSEENVTFGEFSHTDLVCVAVAPFGGLIAVYPAPLAGPVNILKELSQITITNPSGSFVEHIRLEKAVESGTLVSVGWADPELLVCVSSHGQCTVFNAKGQHLRSFQVAQQSWEVSHACVYHSGVVALAYTLPRDPPVLMQVTWEGPLSEAAPRPPTALNSGAPLPPSPHSDDESSVMLFSCMAVAAGPPIEARGVLQPVFKVYLGYQNGGLLIVQEDRCITVPVLWTAQRIAVSVVDSDVDPLAIVTKPAPPGTDRWLHILSSSKLEECDLEKLCKASVQLKDLHSVSVIAPQSQVARCTALDLAWISNAAVAVALRRERSDGLCERAIFAFSEEGCAAELLLDTDEVCALAAERDGCVVVGERSWSLLRDIPISVQRAASVGSTAPAALLRQASRCREEHDARCETILHDIERMPTSAPSVHNAGARSVNGSTRMTAMTEAVLDCISAAVWLSAIPSQRELLRAAIYGRTHTPSTVDAMLLPTAAQLCRVMNTLRSAHGVGRGTTHRQIEWLVAQGRFQYVTDVLCGCELYALAYDVASDPDLELSAMPVLLAWARQVIRVLGTMQDKCLETLKAKLKDDGSVPWATIAGYALEYHLPGLAEQLLSYDCSTASVIPQLMKLKDHSHLALQKALRTADADLTLCVLLHSYEKVCQDVAMEANPHKFQELYQYMWDLPVAVAANGNLQSPQRLKGIVRNQAYDLWHSFLMSMMLPLPDVRLEVLKSNALLQHGAHATPLHSSLIKLSEVCVSCAGPASADHKDGYQKGRGFVDEQAREWSAQQDLLVHAKSTLFEYMDFPKVPNDFVCRGLSGLRPHKTRGKTVWWQAVALERYYKLRARQHVLESDASSTLVGLSVWDTALKLSQHQSRDQFYKSFETEFLTGGGAAGSDQRKQKTKFALTCHKLLRRNQKQTLLDQIVEIASSNDKLKESKVKIGVHAFAAAHYAERVSAAATGRANTPRGAPSSVAGSTSSGSEVFYREKLAMAVNALKASEEVHMMLINKIKWAWGIKDDSQGSGSPVARPVLAQSLAAGASAAAGAATQALGTVAEAGMSLVTNTGSRAQAMLASSNQSRAGSSSA